MGIMSLKAFERWKMITGMENGDSPDIRTMHILSTLVEKRFCICSGANLKVPLSRTLVPSANFPLGLV